MSITLSDFVLLPRLLLLVEVSLLSIVYEMEPPLSPKNKESLVPFRETKGGSQE